MPIPTTRNHLEGLTPSEVQRYNKIGKALQGMQPARAVALLMTHVGAVVDFAQCPEIWLALKDGVEEEIRLAKERMQ